MLIEGTNISAEDYIKSWINNNNIRNEFLLMFKDNINVIIVPTTVITAPRLDEQYIKTDNINRQSIRSLLLRNTIVFNSTGLPSLTIPVGITKKENLPVGIQIIGPPFEEDLLLTIANMFELLNYKRMDNIPPISKLNA
jgi:aspartyl-tRNA(Asn)/glutamyl-tRNA(Gln) amidotransferase subunit A